MHKAEVPSFSIKPLWIGSADGSGLGRETKKVVRGTKCSLLQMSRCKTGDSSGSDNGKQLVYSGKSSQESLPDGLDMGRARKETKKATFCAHQILLF